MSLRRFSTLFTGPVLIVSLLLAGCHRRESTSSSVDISWTITPQPAKVGRTDVTLNLKDGASEPVSGAQIQLEADMTHPGMAPVFGEAREVLPGKYQGGLDLNMPGDWVLVVHGKLANGQRLERQIALNGVEGR